MHRLPYKEKDRSPFLWRMSYKKIETLTGSKGKRIQVKDIND
jgi:hypothetical protein